MHGGANEAVWHTLFDEIGPGSRSRLEEAADRAKAWMENAPGPEEEGHGLRPPWGSLGHGDSRVPTMKAALDKMIAHYGRPELLGLCTTVSNRPWTSAKRIKPNLDYPAGPTYHLMGFDTNMFTPLFVASRITGWTAHFMEQLNANSLIRPLSAYNGPDERHVP
ncbi:citrate/2-methylcitrate synthase [Arthrobacter sp. K5]|uniref:citrate synthase (unknown stereospecificity) n=1 Tax=Arthrobacter sp. K5 TaxID=2839623 RepID=A0AAU8EYC9_9MICC